ncbi:MAG TPA: FkbM family methyltransferase [Bacteroidales bacterium]|jgi:FkbM family methyltransferase|nr:FkbM family methyltransferase [Bacteroidales bacterium]
MVKSFFKRLYLLIPFKKQIFIIFKPFNLPHSITKHLYFKSNFRVKIDKNHSFKMRHYGYQLENELFWYGKYGWEPNSINLWIKLCKNSNVILDIGANTGIYSLIAQSINNAAMIYSFEPVERVYEKLIYNIKLNSYNINAFNIAISDKTEFVRIYDTKTEHEYAATLLNNSSNSLNSYLVKAISLDDFIEQNHIHKIDLIKIDVEAYEDKVLDGYKKYFKTHKPIILLEILYDKIGENVQNFIEMSLIKYDYYFIDEEKGLLKVENIIRRSDKYFNYLLIPS